MLILSCPSKLQLLERLLKKSLPQTLVVHGAVMNINRGNPASHEVIVDSWPEFKAVLTRPRREIASDNADMYTNQYGAFYRDLDAYRTLLLDTDAVNWDQNLYLYGNQDGIYEVSKDAAVARKAQLTAIPHFTYFHPNPNKLPQRQLDPSFTLASLNSSHVDLLNETWLHGGNEQSRRYLANIVQWFPTTCIQDTNGHPISWSLMEPLGAMGHGYTLPLYRRRGYLTVVMTAHAMQAHAAGYPIYGFVALNNVRMQNLQEHYGFQKLSELCNICIHSSAYQREEEERQKYLSQHSAQPIHSTSGAL
ncbi:glycine N-acyltransferase-like protein 3 [Rhineura floridana]|uniref:glycine N-acyltransferase-like protein 3 n=1 Tax=Rhineura floridana TaxID=261503 RepID=UPI002AC82B5C|nr:glycine N-acyltransferase-like protein 3 [Rhineura floridana]